MIQYSIVDQGTPWIDLGKTRAASAPTFDTFIAQIMDLGFAVADKGQHPKDAGGKTNLPGWCPAHLTDGGRKAVPGLAWSVLGIDYDVGPNANLSCKEIAAKLRWQGFVHETSHGGKRLVIALKRDLLKHEVGPALAYVDEVMGGGVNRSAGDMTRMFFVPHGDYDLDMSEGEPFDPMFLSLGAEPPPKVRPKPTPKLHPKPIDPRRRQTYCSTMLGRMMARIMSAPEGERNNTLYREAAMMGSYSESIFEKCPVIDGDVLTAETLIEMAARCSIRAGEEDDWKAADTATRAFAEGTTDPKDIDDLLDILLEETPAPEPPEEDDMPPDEPPPDADPSDDDAASEMLPPVHLLPPIMRDAIEALHTLTYAPPEISVMSALSIVNVAAMGQAVVDPIVFVTPKGIPISLYLLCIARSGGKKSTLYNMLAVGLREHVEEATRRSLAAREKYELLAARYEALKKKALHEKDQAESERQIEALRKPVPPMGCDIITDTATTRFLVKNAQVRPIMALVTDEGGELIYGYSNRTSGGATEFLAAITKVWGGGTLSNNTAVSSENWPDRRLHIFFQIQPSLIASYFNDEMNQHQGGLHRFLVAQIKKSYWEQHVFREEENDPLRETAFHKLRAFNDRIRAMLAQPLRLKPDEHDPFRLDPPKIGWTAAASRHQSAYFNDRLLPKLRHPDSEVEEGFHARCAEQAARIAATLALFEGVKAIGIEQAKAATALVDWFIHQRENLDLAQVAQANERIHSLGVIVLQRLRKRITIKAEYQWTFRELTNVAVQGPFKKADRKTRREVLDDLVERGYLDSAVIKRLNGRKVEVWQVTEEGRRLNL